MRHRVKGKKLGRSTSHRIATLRSLATSLIKYKKIKTTVTKAKAARTFVEPLITKAKQNTVAARRHIAKQIQDKTVLQELFNEVVPKIGERPGGYTRVVKLGNRVGDAAEMAILELVDYNDLGTEKPKSSRTKKKVTKKTEKVEEVKTEEVKTEKDTAETDDLKKIEGIGPKIVGILNDAGITTFKDLAESDTDKVRGLLEEAGGRYKSHDPSTWVEQAKLAADGKWDELEKWQNELDGGKVKKDNDEEQSTKDEKNSDEPKDDK
ncbi:50S ribosomal protein L17 [bacterium BMS3Abin04]|nr:50S ribosomal protein L17 [bacterium BMS3Abin04]